jgi:hypothetical protein
MRLLSEVLEQAMAGTAGWRARMEWQDQQESQETVKTQY